MLTRMIFGVAMAAGAVSAQDADIAVGRDIYMSYCVQCHGFDAMGDGPMAEFLAIDTPGLLGLAARNGGAFPTGPVAMKIDGRSPVGAHGGEMPLFGPVFDLGNTVLVRLPSGQSMMMSEALHDLVGYLESLQVE